MALVRLWEVTIFRVRRWLEEGFANAAKVYADEAMQSRVLSRARLDRESRARLVVRIQPLMTAPTLITNIRILWALIAKPPQLIVINPGAASVTVPLIGKKPRVFA